MAGIDAAVAKGLRTQLDDWRAALAGGAERVGWKIGLNIPEVQARLGITEPVVGHLTSATRLEDGGRYRAAGAVALRGEAEVALRIGTGGGIDGWAPALELVDVGRPPGGVEAIVAGNIFHRAFALGRFGEDPPAQGAEARLTAGGQVADSGRVPAGFDDVVEAVSRHLAAVGESLDAGDVIIAGAVAHEAVSVGDAVAVEIDGLGRLAVTIAP